jgi:hypothetical protein
LLFVCLKKQKRFSNWWISPGVDYTEEKLVVEVIWRRETVSGSRVFFL